MHGSRTIPVEIVVINILVVICCSTPGSTEFMRIYPRDCSNTECADFKIQSVDDKNAILLLTKNERENISLYYSKWLDNFNNTLDEETWNPDNSSIYWSTHSEYSNFTDHLLIPYIVTGYYKLKGESGIEYYYVKTSLKEIASLPSMLFEKNQFLDYTENNRVYLRVCLTTKVERVSVKKRTFENDCTYTHQVANLTYYLCEIDNNFPNETKILVKVHDIRCKQYSIWDQNDLDCIKYFKLENLSAPDLLIRQNVEDSANFPNIWIFGALCLMLIVVIIWLVIFIQRRRQSTRTELPIGQNSVLCFDCISIDSLDSITTNPSCSESNVKLQIKSSNLKDNTRKNVLLLWYPRDCDPFMDLMKEIREYFSRSKGYQVVDLYEERTMAQASELGLKRWISNAIELVANQGHVMLFWSPTAQYIYTRNMPSKSPYRCPKWTDDAFLYGVVALQENSFNVNIIRIGIESMPVDPPQFLGNQFLYFELPGRLSELMTHLEGSGKQEDWDSDDVLMENQQDSLQIIQQNNLLKNYLKDNRQYLDEILDVES